MSFGIIPTSVIYKEIADSVRDKINKKMPDFSVCCDYHYNRSFENRVKNIKKLGFDNIIKVSSNDGFIYVNMYDYESSTFDKMKIDELIDVISSYDFEDDDDDDDNDDGNCNYNNTTDNIDEDTCTIC